MKIILLGYGKMGRYIEGLAVAAGDEVVLKVDEDNRPSITAQDLRAADVAIEFSRPDSAVANIELALEAGVPIVVGTTGWLGELTSVREKVGGAAGALFWASNFSIGVNIFFAAAKKLAELSGQFGGYAPTVSEIHHEQKLDSPSGTGITLAQVVGEALPGYGSWELTEVHSAVPQQRVAPAAPPGPEEKALPIVSYREPDVPGTHLLALTSAVDTIELKHVAHSREGFARGALTAARWLIGKRGVYTMRDLLDLD